MSPSELFLLAIVLIFSVPYLVWRLFRMDGYAPLVVVQIIGGVLLGPGVLGAQFPAYYHFIFNPRVMGALDGIAWWAVILFVWVAGLELDLKAVWARRRETVVTAAFALGAPLALGAAAAAGLLAVSQGWAGPRGAPWQVVVGIGMACAVTALPILVLFLEKLDILRRPFGQRILGYASLDDIAIWGVLAVILVDVNRIERQVGFLVIFALAALGLRRGMARLSRDDRWFVGLVWLAASAFLADWSGLHFMVGAFLAGLVLDADLFDRARLDGFRNNILLAVMPVFFLVTGLRTSWTAGGAQVFAAALVLLAASVAGKLGGVHLAGRVLNWRPGEATVIGWLLQTKALIMIIFMNILLDRGVISAQTFTATLLMAVGSTLLTMPNVAKRLRALPAGD